MTLFGCGCLWDWDSYDGFLSIWDCWYCWLFMSVHTCKKISRYCNCSCLDWPCWSLLSAAVHGHKRTYCGCCYYFVSNFYCCPPHTHYAKTPHDYCHTTTHHNLFNSFGNFPCPVLTGYSPFVPCPINSSNSISCLIIIVNFFSLIVNFSLIFYCSNCHIHCGKSPWPLNPSLSIPVWNMMASLFLSEINGHFGCEIYQLTLLDCSWNLISIFLEIIVKVIGYILMTLAMAGYP